MNSNRILAAACWVEKGELMNATLLYALGISLASTIILEAVFFLLSGKRNKKDLLLLVLVNVLTNPAVVLLYRLCRDYTNWNTFVIQIPLEVFAVLTEGYCLKKYGLEFKRPYLFSISVNAFSYGAGILGQTLSSFFMP